MEDLEYFAAQTIFTQIMALLNRLWELIVNVWQAGEYGIGGGDLLVGLGIFAFFAFLRGLFTRFVLNAAKRWTQRTKTEIDDMLREALEKPLKFFFLILGAFFAVEYLALEGFAATFADRGLRTLIAVGIFWSFHAAVQPLSQVFQLVENILPKEIVAWLVTVIRWGIILTGLATILQIWGIEIAPIIAGFGLFGVAVALGAQDLFKNLLAGLSILVERRFKIGDRVEVKGVVEGIVEQIGFRSTRIRRFDMVTVTVPNNMFSDYALVNYSSVIHRRIFWKIGLEYRTSIAQMKQIRDAILDWLDKNPDFVTDKKIPCNVYIDNFNDSSIDMMVYCFTQTTDWQTWLAHKQDLAYAVKEIVEQAGAGFAFPSQSVYVEAVPDESMSDESAPDKSVPPDKG